MKKKILTMRSSVKTLSIKCYDEQMPSGWEDVQERIKSIDNSKYQVLAIKHDKDYNSDDYWEPSTEKAHYHIIIRVLNRQSAHVQTILNMLNIVYRKESDTVLWEQHGVETIKDFASMAVYITHDTEQAINDGKTHYELEEIASNLTIDEIKQVRDGYIRVSNTSGKVSIQELTELDELAKQMGYELKDFDEFYDSLSFQIRSNTKMRTIRESYERGVAKRVRDNNEVLRLCIFIQGKANKGKTYASIKALSGIKTLTVSGGKTGKFDALTASTGAIVIDDDVCPYLLNMADNYMCQAYRRNKNNPFWCGQYFIVTSNLTFEEWVKACGIKSEEHIRALKTRFFICHIPDSGKSQLLCDSVCVRGSYDDQAKRKEMFIKFFDKYNKIIATYVPDLRSVDYSDIIYDAEIEKQKKEEAIKKSEQEYKEKLKQEHGKNAKYFEMFD